jgi:hypothetical protein
MQPAITARGDGVSISTYNDTKIIWRCMSIRYSLGGGTHRPRGRDRGRVRSAQSQKSSREPYEDMARPGRGVTALFIAFSVQCQAATREIAAAVTVGLVAATFIVVWSSVVGSRRKRR